MPDILFLGDLGTGRNILKVGRLKLHFEEGVNEEWFLWTSVQKESGCPNGSGSAIHASTAKHISKLGVFCPAGIDDEESATAVGARLLGLKLLGPNMLCPLFLLGVDQHVARDSYLKNTSANGGLYEYAHARRWRAASTYWRHERCSRGG